METYVITVNGVSYEVTVEKKSGSAAPAAAAPAPVKPQVQAQAAAPAAPKAPSAAAGSVKVTAGAAGKIWKIVAAPGQAVKTGDTVVILEAMKMEIPVVAPKDGTVATIDCKEGDTCEAGALLATLK